MHKNKTKPISNILRRAGDEGIINIVKYAYSYITNTGRCPIRYALIEVTEKCNLRCIMCGANKILKRETEMNYDLFKKIIDELCQSGLKSVTIGSIGEPTMHKDLPKMLEYIQQKKIKLELISNLSLPMNKELIEAIRNVDKLTVSIDGATKETYEKIRVGANFERTISNLKKVASTKNSLPITINYVIQKDNYREIPQMIKLLDPISNINNLATGFAHIGIDMGVRIKLNKKELHEFKSKIVPECEKHKEKQVITTNHLLKSDYWKKNDIYSAHQTTNIFAQINKIPCYILWTSTFITPDSILHPCCTLLRKKEYYLGDMKKDSFKDIWNGKKYNNLRKKLKKDKPPSCKNCTAVTENKKIHNMLKLWKPSLFTGSDKLKNK